MNFRPAGIGAEPKKLIFLVGIVLVGGGVVYWANQSDSPTGAKAGTTPVASVTPAAKKQEPSAPRPASTTTSSGSRTTPRGGRASGDDFRPTLKPPEGLDLTRVDPTLRKDLLAQVRKISVEGGSRSLFEFYTPPPPPVPVPTTPPIVPQPVVKADTKGAPPVIAGPPPTPPRQPIPLKFYGYSGNLRSTARKAFFLDGEDIVQAGENDIVHNRYKIIRIGVNSAVVEDTVAKPSNQQTLPLADEAQ